MKRIPFLALVVLLIAFGFGCGGSNTTGPDDPPVTEDPGDEIPDDPETPEEPYVPPYVPEYIVQAPNVSLIALDNGATNSSSAVLSTDADVSDEAVLIDFGEVRATKSISFVLMNTGNTNVYDVTFSADSLVVFPDSINVLGIPGGGMAAWPIVTVTLPNYTPIDDVGEPFDLVLGDFMDNLALSYDYDTLLVHMDTTYTQLDSVTWDTTYALDTTGVDSVHDELDYLVTGERVAVQFTLTNYDGSPLGDPYHHGTKDPNDRVPYSGTYMDFRNGTIAADDSLLLTNVGNRPCDVLIWQANPYSLVYTVFDTVAVAPDEKYILYLRSDGTSKAYCDIQFGPTPYLVGEPDCFKMKQDGGAQLYIEVSE